MDDSDYRGEPAVLISRTALLHNLRLIRRNLDPHVKICAMVKADAYGHGASIIVDTLCHCTDDHHEPPLVDAIALASIDEALALPRLPEPVQTYIMRPVENVYLGRQREKIEAAIARGFVLTVCTASAADDLARAALAVGKRASVQIMVDTGMTRTGCAVTEVESLARHIESRASLQLEAMCTHFVTAEKPGELLTAHQYETFREATEGIVRHARSAGRKILRHACNSAGVFFHKMAHLDMVRPGIALYGIDPAPRVHLDRPLRPVLRWAAPLIAVMNCPRGQSVGYGQTWIAKRDTRVGIVPIGYGDGYPRALSNKGTMLVHGRPVPVVGRVSMDMTAIDLGELREVRVGDEVTVIDTNPLSPASVYRIAQHCDTIPYEILCGIAHRVRRVAMDDVVEVPIQDAETPATQAKQPRVA